MLFMFVLQKFGITLCCVCQKKGLKTAKNSAFFVNHCLQGAKRSGLSRARREKQSVSLPYHSPFLHSLQTFRCNTARVRRTIPEILTVKQIYIPRVNSSHIKMPYDHL